VQKFGFDGGVQAGFWQQAAGAGMTLPVAVAVMPTPPAASTPSAASAASDSGEWTVLVLDAGATPRICVFSPDGALLHVLALSPAAAQPLALAAGAGRIYVGDNASRQLLVLAADGTALGEAEAFSGPVAGLALAPADNALWLHPGSGSNGAAPLRLDLGGGRRRDGVLWGGPFGPYAGAGEPVVWHHVEALAELLAGSDIAAAPASAALASALDGGHLQLFFATGDSPAAAPPAPADSPLDPFGPAWTALPPDALQGLIRGTPAVYLWLGAHFTGEGQQSARLSQVRIDFDPVTWSQYLPAIYREATADPELLERFLALYASGFHDVEAEIRHLGRRLDVTGAPPSWLPWLAGWVGIELEEGWTADRQREAIAGAFAAAAQRGTVRGLAAALRFQAGVDVHLAEPILGANWWSLPADSAAATSGTATGGGLGFDTVLAPTGLEGAVLGTTAALDRSYLTDDEESPGAHLYAGLAHQFAVQVYERQVADPRRRAQLIATLEREKPAHTAYHLCVVEPRLRVGFQAVLGVDTVVGGPPPPRRLGGGADLVLGGAPPGRIGEDDRVGIGTRLGAGWRPPSSLAGPAR
jgi:phage tail-like protein